MHCNIRRNTTISHLVLEIAVPGKMLLEIAYKVIKWCNSFETRTLFREL